MKVIFNPDVANRLRILFHQKIGNTQGEYFKIYVDGITMDKKMLIFRQLDNGDFLCGDDDNTYPLRFNGNDIDEKLVKKIKDTFLIEPIDKRIRKLFKQHSKNNNIINIYLNGVQIKVEIITDKKIKLTKDDTKEIVFNDVTSIKDRDLGRWIINYAKETSAIRTSGFGDNVRVLKTG